MTYKTIKVQDHAVHLLENLNRQRDNKAYCDVVLKVENKLFPAHRNVLSACSEYFCTMFQSKMQEQYAKDVLLEGVTAAAVEQVLEYIYTEEIKLSQENVSDILQAASLMLLTEAYLALLPVSVNQNTAYVVIKTSSVNNQTAFISKEFESLCLKTIDLLEVISDYLTESVSPSTCLYLRDVSKLFNLEPLMEKAEECIFENFEEIASQEKFCDLNEADISQFLSSDDLKVHSENLVFEALVRWVNEDLMKRRSLFPSLFKYIRLQHVSQGFLTSNLRKQPLVKQFPECRDLLDDAFHFHLQPNEFEPEKPRRGCGFFLLNQQGGVEHLNFTSGGLDVTQIAKPTFQVYFTYAIAKSNRIVYFCGSHANSSSSVISFDGQNFKLEGNMNRTNLADATAFCIGDNLYVGGIYGHEGMDVYQLRPSFKFTETIQPNQPQYASSVVVGGDAYVIGGLDQYHSGTAQSTVTSFNPATKKWTNKANMNHGRYFCGVAVLGSKIFVCGGNTSKGSGYINSMEYMDVAQNVWTMIGSQCPNNLGSTSICVVGQELYVVGMSCNVLWKYDTESEKWNQDQRYGNRPGGFKILSLN